MPQRIAVLISSLLFSPIAFAHFQGFGGSAYSVILTIVFFIHLLTVGPLLLVYIRRHKYSLLPGFLIFLVGSAILVPMEAMALFPLAAALLILKNGDFILLTGLILASLASIVYMVNSWRK